LLWLAIRSSSKIACFTAFKALPTVLTLALP
jgi:hypothetical protein